MNPNRTQNIRAKLHEVKGPRGTTWFFSYNLRNQRIRSERFKDKDKAKYEMEKVERRYEVREAYQPTCLNREEVKDAEAAVLALRRKFPAKTLTDAAAWFVQHFRDASTSPLLADACDAYMTSIPPARRESSRKEYELHFKDLKIAFGDRRLGELTTDDFRKYLEKQTWKQVSRWHRRQTASRLYNWSMAQTPPLVHENPLAGIEKMTKKGLRKVLPAVSVLSPDEVKSLLGESMKTRYIGFAVLGLFAGLRREEIKKFSAQPGGGWDHINFDTMTIQIAPDVGKNGKRVIQIKPTLASWLTWLRDQNKMRFYPVNLNKGWNAVRRNSLSEAKLRCTNLLRHSFITYSLRMPNASYAQISRDAGNSESMIKEHYEDVQATNEMAAAYWSMGPAQILKDAGIC